jgi:hypothetical protein
VLLGLFPLFLHAFSLLLFLFFFLLFLEQEVAVVLGEVLPCSHCK